MTFAALGKDIERSRISMIQCMTTEAERPQPKQNRVANIRNNMVERINQEFYRLSNRVAELEIALRAEQRNPENRRVVSTGMYLNNSGKEPQT